MLELRDVRAGYGAINVLWDVSLEIGTGRLTALVGPNGAGKTTLLRAVMGLIPAQRGHIVLDGNDIAGTSTWNIAERGIALIPEGRMIFRDMTIEENLMLGAFPKQRRAGAASRLEPIYDLFPLLRERRRQLAGTLSGGQAQMLALGRGLMSDPKLLLVDEPSLGLAPVMVQEVFAILRRLKDEGRTILLVEQNTNMALDVADHVYLMQGGKVALSKPAAEVDIAQLHDLYFAR